jgi:parallel beta-helix repeat protein
MRKAAVVTLILIGLLPLSAVRIQLIKAEYQGNITINADGSVSPSTASIEKTGNIYTLTSDLIGSITVNSSNIVLDGKGYRLLSDERDDRFGIVALIKVSNVTVKNLIILHSEYKKTIGISLTDASNAIVANNTITGFDSVQAWNGGTYTGIYVEGGNSNIITGNNLTNNLCGLLIRNTFNNSIIGNNIVGQQIFRFLYTTGVRFTNSPNNKIYHNNFVNRTYLVRLSNSINVWDDSYLGNYWGNYKEKYPTAIQVDDSGVYNVPYSIDEQNTDRYPLTQPYNSEFYAPKVPVKISVLSPVNQVFNESSVPLAFTVNKQAVWMGYSLDGQDNVTVAGNSTISGLSNGLHNVTVYAEDTFGSEGASETIIFTIKLPEPFPTALVAAASVGTVAVVSVVLLFYFKKRHH